MEINFPLEEAEKTIKGAVLGDKPFVFTRFGDGESYVLNGIEGDNIHSEFIDWIHKDWGFEGLSPKETLKELGKPILRALLNSDLIGIAGRVKPPLCLLPSGKRVCWLQVVKQDSIGNPRNIDSFLQGRETCIITSNGPEILENLKKFTSIKFNLISLPYFLTMDAFQEQLRRMEIPEDLVLWGYGPAKNIGVYLRDKFGKICIDMGAVLDAWSGKNTRPSFKHKFPHCLP